MAQYSRGTVLAATDLLENAGHARITRFLLEHGLEGRVHGNSMRDRASGIALYLLEDSERLNEDGENLADAVVNDLVTGVIQQHARHGEFDYEAFSRYASFVGQPPVISADLKEGPTCGRAFRFIGERGDGYLAPAVAARTLTWLS
jgi:hypothetical protein